MDLLTTALSGINASRSRALAAANNLANVNTPGYQAVQANTSTAPGGIGARIDSVSISVSENLPEGSNVDAARELINLKVEENITRANINVAKTGDELTRTAIDLIG